MISELPVAENQRAVMSQDKCPVREARKVEMDQVLSQMQGPVPIGASNLLMAFLKLVAPVSLGVSAIKLIGWALGLHRNLIIHPRHKLITFLNVNCLAEAAWVLVCALVKARGQRKFARERDLCAKSEADNRRRLFAECLASMERPQEFVTNWFGDGVSMDDICRGNFEDFVSWSIFYKDASALSPAEYVEMEGYVDQFEKSVGHPLKDGHNGAIKCYKFTFEPVESIHRPLCYYAATHGVAQRLVAPAAMRLMGFSGRNTEFQSFDVYVRRGTAKADSAAVAPIVFVHGIGIGLPLYFQFLRTLLATVGPERDVIVLELSCISQQIFPKPLLPELFVEDCCQLLGPYMPTDGGDSAGTGAVFLGHSYGCFCLSWVAKRAPRLVRSLGFLDPGSFCLHDSTTLRAVVYKQPHTDQETLFYYYMRSELFFNNHLRRDFRWQDNHLSLSEIPEGCRTLVVLSEKDEIMPVQAVKTLHERTANPETHTVMWLENSVHGGMLLMSYGEEVCEKITRTLL